MIRPLREALTATGLIILLGTTACGFDRPSLTHWAGTWGRTSRITSGIDDHHALEDRAECASLLARAKAARSTLLPTPDSVLDPTVEAWLEETASLGFRCPRAHGQVDDHTEIVRKIRSLEAQISAGVPPLEPQNASAIPGSESATLSPDVPLH